MPDILHGFDKFHDECGVFALYGHPEAANLTYLGLYALQHRGQESAGIASSDGRGIHCHKSMGHVADIFTPEVLGNLPGELAIGHTRYSTAGDTVLLNAQPFSVACNKEYLMARLLELSTAAGAADPQLLADSLALLVEGVYATSQTFGPGCGPMRSAPATAALLVRSACGEGRAEP